MTVQNPSFHTVEGQQLYTPLPGPEGPQGPAGTTGPQGLQGIQGPQGDVGPAGPAGPEGPQGIQGALGPTGPSGAVIVYGVVNPNGATGNDGDSYINTATNMLFGPKAAGAWPAGVSLVGPTGPTGPTGPAGSSGSPAAPTIRASRAQNAIASSYVVTWPTGTVAGDVVFIFGSHAWGFTNPAGWTVLDNNTGANVNGLLIAKEMTAGDISTGSVTLTTASSDEGLVLSVTIDGSTLKGIRDWSTVRSASSAATVPIALSKAFALNDLVLWFHGARSTNATYSFASGNFTSVNSVAGAGLAASGIVAKYTGSGKYGAYDTINWIGGSHYYAAVMLHG